jgi:hypothetical protein
MTKLNYFIKTHMPERVYNTPHFYILNKGLNSGRPMNEPCPNCFVVTTDTIEERDSLFYLSLGLKEGRYFTYYLRGSVILFITIDDTRKVLNKALQNYEADRWQVRVEKLKKITIYEENLKQQIKTLGQLKIALLRT